MIFVDTRRFPLVVIEFREALTLEDLQAFAGFLQEKITAKQRFAMILRPVDLPIPPVAPVKWMAGWMRENAEDMTRYNVCVGLQIESAAMRGVMGFFNTMVTPPSPQAAFADARRTEAWVIEQLAAAGLSPGPLNPTRAKERA